MKEAKGGIKFNKLLEYVSWQFFEPNDSASNIIVENNAKLAEYYINAYDEDFEKSKIDLIFGQKIKEKLNNVLGK